MIGNSNVSLEELYEEYYKEARVGSVDISTMSSLYNINSPAGNISIDDFRGKNVVKTYFHSPERIKVTTSERDDECYLYPNGLNTGDTIDVSLYLFGQISQQSGTGSSTISLNTYLEKPSGNIPLGQWFTNEFNISEDINEYKNISIPYADASNAKIICEWTSGFTTLVSGIITVSIENTYVNESNYVSWQVSNFFTSNVNTDPEI